jgi:hypothetical protein
MLRSFTNSTSLAVVNAFVLSDRLCEDEVEDPGFFRLVPIVRAEMGLLSSPSSESSKTIGLSLDPQLRVFRTRKNAPGPSSWLNAPLVAGNSCRGFLTGGKESWKGGGGHIDGGRFVRDVDELDSPVSSCKALVGSLKSDEELEELVASVPGVTELDFDADAEELEECATLDDGKEPGVVF